MTSIRSSRARGFTLIEIMVGVAVGLLAIVIMMQVLGVSQSYRRSTGAGADAQTSGTIGLYSLERDMRMAGYGVSDKELQGCRVQTYNSGRSPSQVAIPMLPVRITQGGVGASDTITVVYGNSRGLVTNQVFSAAAAAGADFPLKDRAGLFQDDFIVAAEGSNCLLGRITSLPGGSLTVQRSGGNFNSAMGMAFTTAAKLYNMGANPVFNQYAVRNGNLAVCDLLRSPNCADDASWVVVAEGIVAMKAEYGLDLADTAGVKTNPDGRVDAYSSTIGDLDADGVTDTNGDGINDDPDDVSRVLAIRIGIIAQTHQKQGTSEQTPASIEVWPGGPTYDVPDRYLRYRVFETVVPLRNAIWR